MHSSIGHLQFNIAAENMAFYKDLLTFLGWQIIYDDPAMLGAADASGISVWFGGFAKAVQNDYDGPGMNHIAFRVETLPAVDATVQRLHANHMSPLFETPRHRPEFSASADETYYQVMFETPDRILIEVVYQGLK
ncbi:MAG TPA: VOC family protein [Anaerolineales bacterium]|nr:VOC family protein [Anaerolineales bacterium]